MAGLGLVLALLWLQQVGLVHRYAHGTLPAAAPVASRVAGTLPPGDTAGLPAHDKLVCLVLDQLCIGDAVPLAAVSLPMPWPLLVPMGEVRSFDRAPVHKAFLARGPPVFSL